MGQHRAVMNSDVIECILQHYVPYARLPVDTDFSEFMETTPPIASSAVSRRERQIYARSTRAPTICNTQRTQWLLVDCLSVVASLKDLRDLVQPLDQWGARCAPKCDFPPIRRLSLPGPRGYLSSVRSLGSLTASIPLEHLEISDVRPSLFARGCHSRIRHNHLGVIRPAGSIRPVHPRLHPPASLHTAMLPARLRHLLERRSRISRRRAPRVRAGIAAAHDVYAVLGRIYTIKSIPVIGAIDKERIRDPSRLALLLRSLLPKLKSVEQAVEGATPKWRAALLELRALSCNVSQLKG
ncbi:hypothetical protein C8Q72DRAFT_843759 [Fomitopsis betulina]|nr:hypothetical protein C8Q72DRAFT_843759 [Fomitopsis betulina]